MNLNLGIADHKLVKKNRNLILYGLIGITGATLDFLLYILLYKVFGVPPFAASFLSVSAGILNNFIWNIRHNFRVTGKMLSRFASFYLTGLAGAVLSSVLIIVMYNGLGINATIAKLITIVPVVLLQFWVNKRISFSDNPHRFFSELSKFLKRHWLKGLVVILCAIFFLLPTFSTISVDDMDNMLGGKLILHGQLPYNGFFSQHTPGMYFLSALIYPFTQNNVFIYRLIFNILVFAVVLITCSLLWRRGKITASKAYLVAVCATHAVSFGQDPVGETLAAVMLPLALTLIIFRDGAGFSRKTIVALSIILFTIPFAVLNFAFPALMLYILVTVLLTRAAWSTKHWFDLLYKLIILGLPYVAFFLYLFATHSYHLAKYDLFTYNSKYYAAAVGQHGGSVLSVLAVTFLGAFHDLATIATNILDARYTLQALLLAGFGCFAGYLWINRKRLEALSLLLLMLTLDIQTNIFEPTPTFTATLKQLNHHSTPYFGVAIFVGVVGFIELLRYMHNKRRPGSTSIIVLATAYLVLIPIAAMGIWANKINKVFISKSSQSYYAYSKAIKRHNLAIPMNQLAGTDSTAWIGDSHFVDQLYLKRKRATEFTFWQPWMDVAPELKARLMQELRQDRPAIIYFNLNDHPGYTYNTQLREYLQKDYFRVSDKRLQYYYFSNSDHTKFMERLVHYGYKTT